MEIHHFIEKEHSRWTGEAGPSRSVHDRAILELAAVINKREWHMHRRSQFAIGDIALNRAVKLYPLKKSDGAWLGCYKALPLKREDDICRERLIRIQE